MRSATSSTRTEPRPGGRRWVRPATLYGVGRLPGAPGTYGALLGLPLAIGLRLAALDPAIEAAIIVVLLGAAVLIAGRAARALGRRDPPQIVLDEFASIPLAFFLVPFGWWWYVVGFAVHRVLDVLKPPPIRQLERLRGGWGIVADDAAAAVVANLVLQLLARVLL
jgi:phosphatidylglycerophosphatase A